MSAVFSYAAVYAVSAAAQSPIRSGNGDLQTVLKNAQGCFFLQGSSLAGAMRQWAVQKFDPALVSSLFGSPENGGRLIVSDAVFSEDARMLLRPRLRIDGASGTAAERGKFDVAHVQTGSAFAFSVTWLGTKELTGEMCCVEQLLAALNSGEILLGAMKTGGFGRVRLTAAKTVYDLLTPEGRAQWLGESGTPQRLELPEAENSRYLFTLSGSTDSLLVKAAAAETEDGKNYTPNISENGRAVIPGSSLKGAVRARAALIAGACGKQGTAERLFGSAPANPEKKAGLVRCSDILPEDAKRKITRIRVNRFTGGVMQGGLFTEEPISGRITAELSADAGLEAADCALLLYALRDLGLGLYNLGSGASVGRGFLCVDKITVNAPDGRKAVLCFDGNRNCSILDDEGLLSEWAEAWRREAAK